LQGGRGYRQEIKRLLTPIIFTAAAFLVSNAAIHHTVALFPAGQSFFMATLIGNNGPADKYLREACPQAGYKICAYVNRFPIAANDLLWKGDLYNGLGGFEGMREESRAIVIATVKNILTR